MTGGIALQQSNIAMENSWTFTSFCRCTAHCQRLMSVCYDSLLECSFSWRCELWLKTSVVFGVEKFPESIAWLIPRYFRVIHAWSWQSLPDTSHHPGSIIPKMILALQRTRLLWLETKSKRRFLKLGPQWNPRFSRKELLEFTYLYIYYMYSWLVGNIQNISKHKSASKLDCNILLSIFQLKGTVGHSLILWIKTASSSHSG